MGKVLEASDELLSLSNTCSLGPFLPQKNVIRRKSSLSLLLFQFLFDHIEIFCEFCMNVSFSDSSEIPGSMSREDSPMGKAPYWDAFRLMLKISGEAHQHCKHLLSLCETLQTAMEQNKTIFQCLAAQREECRQLLRRVNRIVSRYASVKEPVVASDGFTYEKQVLENYLEDCRKAEQPATSQQTNEVLQQLLYPNKSLKRIVNLLTKVHISATLENQKQMPYDLDTLEEIRSRIALGGSNSTVEQVDDPTKLLHPSEPLGKTKTESPSQRNSMNTSTNLKTTPDKEKKPRSQLSNSQPTSKDTTREKGDSIETHDNFFSAASPTLTLHPCLRIYGRCNFKDNCIYAKYPFETCLGYLKGRCRLGNNCSELHISTPPPTRGRVHRRNR